MKLEIKTEGGLIIIFSQVDNPSCFVGLVLEDCDLPHKNHGHVILADPSPILFYQIGSNEIRCLVDVPGQKVPSVGNGEMANYLKTVVAPQVIIQFSWNRYYPFHSFTELYICIKLD